MNVLVIYAHPKTPGHNPAILSEVEKNLKQNKLQYEVLDLYKMKYDPVLHEKEHYTAGNHHVSPENKKIQKKIAEAELMIFIYPVWWYSMPAVLKGFLDKVLTPRFAFTYEGKIPKGLLKGKQALVFYTTGGPKAYYSIMGNTPKKNIKMTLSFCGIRTRVCHIGSCQKIDEMKKSKIKKIVEKELRRVLS